MATIKGTWLFNTTPTVPTSEIDQDVNFTSDGQSYTSMRFYTTPMGGEDIPCVGYDSEEPCFGSFGEDDPRRIVDFGTTEQTVSDTYYAHFTANATEQKNKSTVLTLDLSTLGLGAGSHKITVVARGEGYKNAVITTAVDYSVLEQLVTPTTELDGTTLNIYDESGIATEFDILVDGEVKETVSASGLPAVGTSLEDCTWEQISAISEAGKGAEYFSVGDTKSVYIKGKVGTLEVDDTYYVYILGFDHNGSNGITFGTFKTADGVDVALCDSKYSSSSTDGTKYFNVNHWGNYNYGGWAGCDMRYDILGSTDVQPSGYGANAVSGRIGNNPSDTCTSNPVANTLMAALPADLRAVLKPITKYTDNVAGGSGSVTTNISATIDYLPLLAEYEIFGTISKANEHEKNKQAQYAYFAAGNSKVKYNHSSTGSAVYWWERSPRAPFSGNFCYVASIGVTNGDSASNSGGLAPIFLV